MKIDNKISFDFSTGAASSPRGGLTFRSGPEGDHPQRIGDLRAIMVKHPSASVKPVTNQGRIIREDVLGLILLLVV